MPPEPPQHETPSSAVPPKPSSAGDLDDLDTALARRAPLRWRLVRGALIALALLIAVAVVARGLLALPGRPSLPPVAGVAASTLIASNISYGTVTVNGVRLGDTLPVMATLTAGSNFIKLDAPPFLPVSCVVTGLPVTPVVDPASVGRCSITFDRIDTALAHTVVNVLLTGTDLPPDALANAERVVVDDLAQVALGTATVPPGQYYATGATEPGAITSRKATEPLRAVPSIILAPANDDVFPSDALSAGAMTGSDPRTTLDRCADLGCALPVDAGYTVPPHGWLIGTALALDWRFTTATGQAVGEALYGLGTMAVPLVVSADGASWTLATDVHATNEPFVSSLDQCMLGVTVVTQLLTQALGPRQVNVSERLASQSGTGPEGCAVMADVPSFTDHPVTFIWRFGVVLAADSAAHAVLPNAPLAPQDEQRAVGI